MKDFDLSSFRQTSSMHYVFHYRPGSAADRDLAKIIQIQEKCFQKITNELGVKPTFPLHYVLCETPDEVGVIYGDNEPCNGFADTPDTVFAVYSDNVSCIGPHEDTHLIATLIARPDSNFIREGLAMYMDRCWWGRPNEKWAAEFIQANQSISLEELLCNERFWVFPEEITYPLSGAFTRWLVEEMGMRRYLEVVYRDGNQTLASIEAFFGRSFSEIEQVFREWIAKTTKNHE